MMIGYITVLQAQTCTPFTQTLFYQDFESSTSSNLVETIKSLKSTISYSNTTNYTIGSRSRVVNKKEALVEYGSVDASFANNVKASFYFAPQDIDYISDNITFYISTN